MSDRNLTTTVSQVFGNVSKGSECRICGRPVEDGRRKYCSSYCSNLASAVMSLLNWSSVRRRIIERDGRTCQHCGYDGRDRRARHHIRERIDEQLPEKPTTPSALELGRGEADDFDWEQHREEMDAWEAERDALRERYGDPYEIGRQLEVDHIQPIAGGGHPFDPGNLQTLCADCHTDKTAAEASERAQTPSRTELQQTLAESLASDGGAQR